MDSQTLYVPGALLSQTASSPSASNAYSAAYYTEINLMMITNTTVSARSFQLFHSQLTAGAGTALYTTTNALFYDYSLAAKDVFRFQSQHLGSGIMMKPGDRIGFQGDNTAGVVLHLYGTVRAAR